jgi:hypothetical protein
MRLGLIPRLRRAAAFAAMLAVLLQAAIAATHHHALAGPGDLAAQKAFAAAPQDGSGPLSDESTCEICLGLAFGSAFALPDAIALDMAEASAPADRVAPEDREGTILLAFRSRAPPQPL